ncbi:MULTISPECIES: hypothetical protein [unclassified Paenibacillus]|uniref:hypothetical protein n=1 Tax=unclassified Paenibacillus TaxID=185978 RepID=UPI002783E602|nr:MULTISPECIES: hypothetical protein [unclassified Paenibacillus]MDQ0896226.1 hypothetical protein [Paenibacillus sp. V4I7]MDQ0913958.1 hypothetical protein [Paenibacillus sp. V4I5]
MPEVEIYKDFPIHSSTRYPGAIINTTNPEIRNWASQGGIKEYSIHKAPFQPYRTYPSLEEAQAAIDAHLTKPPFKESLLASLKDRVRKLETGNDSKFDHLIMKDEAVELLNDIIKEIESGKHG